jgi:thiol:disulfide interchange protein DsbD
MATGIFGKSLPILSGILPPIENIGTLAGVSADKLRPMAYGLVGFSDYDDALEYAKKVNKPVFIDFTGYACANCRKMEESVWVNPTVLAKLKNDFVIASLYVDDKKELSKAKQYISTYDDEPKVTIGDKNMDLEITKFNNNAQPFYAIVSPEGKILSNPIGYSSLSDFSKFLHFSKN